MPSQTPKPVDSGMLIGGEWAGGERPASSRIAVFNPARRDEVVGTIPRGTPDDAARAIAAAKAAQPSWAAKSFSERAAILSRILARLEDDIDARAVLFVRENGKTLAEAKGELLGIPARQKLTLGFAAELDSVTALPAPHGKSTLRHLPYGVVASIVPWNAPVGLAFLQIVPALFAGNAVVLKPPETCPLSLIQAVRMIVGLLPAGLLNIVTGLPAEIGDTLTSHPDIAKIAFTGSVPSARKIIASAAGTIKGTTFELGGNDAAIILDDADLTEAAMARMAKAVYRMTGQVCMAIKRIYVPEALEKTFLEAFMPAVDAIVTGDGLDPATTMGPMHTAQSLERAENLVADASRRGAAVRRLGQVRDKAGFARGHFMQPVVASNISEDAPLVCEEQFCPAVPVLTYREIDDAIARANATVYGFGGSVWSKDIPRAAGLAQRLEAGTVFVNAHGTESVNRSLPYGGIKQSGLGRRAGIDGIREYMQLQTLTTFEQ